MEGRKSARRGGVTRGREEKINCRSARVQRKVRDARLSFRFVSFLVAFHCTFCGAGRSTRPRSSPTDFLVACVLCLLDNEGRWTLVSTLILLAFTVLSLIYKLATRSSYFVVVVIAVTYRCVVTWNLSISR